MCLKPQARKPLLEILNEQPPGLLVTTHAHRFWIARQGAWDWLGIPAPPWGRMRCTLSQISTCPRVMITSAGSGCGETPTVPGRRNCVIVEDSKTVVCPSSAKASSGSFVTVEINGKAQLSKMFFGKGSAGMRFDVVLKVKCLLPVGECKICLDLPRTIFSRVWTFSVVVLTKAVSQIFRKTSIVLSRIGKTFQHIHEIEISIHNCPPLRPLGFVVAGFRLHHKMIPP